MKIGYARVSTQEQALDVQVIALEQFGCDIIYKDKISSMRVRPELDKALQSLTKGDVFIVYKLDRLGRSLVDLVNNIDYISKKGAEFVSIIDKFDTTTTQGKMLLGMTIVFAEFERNLISDRTKASLKVLKDKGVKLGTPVRVDRKKAKQVYNDMHKYSLKMDTILKKYGISRRTYYNYIAMFQ